MAKGDDILLGDLGDMGARSSATDTDGDGVSDTQELLDGTDAGDASDYLLRNPTLKPDGDPRADLDLAASLEREVGFDSTTLIPDGMSVVSGLSGLTILDGSALPTGSNQLAAALGDAGSTGPGSAILEGQLGANSPLGMQRDPLATALGDAGLTGPGSGPPTGADLGLGARNWGLVGNDDDFDDPYEYPPAPDPGHTPPPDAPPDGGGAVPVSASVGEFVTDGTAPTDLKLGVIGGITVDGSGQVYVSDGLFSVIFRFEPGAGIELVIADQTDSVESIGMPANRTRLRNPIGLAVDAGGSLLFTDTSRVLRIVGAAG